MGFETTQNKRVDGVDVSGVRVAKKREYRQYMNVRNKQAGVAAGRGLNGPVQLRRR